ncbi:1, 4-alpha-D-glucan glucohydrolase [Paraphaeosphaeria sporulosa]|uniref:Glucoamylase n=1 Tax=Paraphaeosphaeria sporulosa TaxID=1460663 RepID=A0A177CBP3_9PLEO|nr:1, 4-alpha-D-glucan glucohydrolase [Paraphaeosphaeria sporulosa]OAG04611.1 1, 4-alpha-D-glucan glucohydrolase [Paraphaeosphaeria sporulosa]
MKFQALLAALAATLLDEASAKAFRQRRAEDLASRIEGETTIALQGVLNNFGPDGSEAPGASAGVLIASPSTDNPNYYYTWTRDAALTLKMVVDEFLHGKGDLQPYIRDYVKAQAIVQTISNPSGALGSGRGLGEPKYYANLTRFNGDWGRPQRDGPALRATALITYSRYLLSTGIDSDGTEADNIWPIIQNDLNYVAQYWNQTGFDLWEEVDGSSFFTTAAQYRALIEGATLGQRLQQDVSAYESQAPNVFCFLQTFWNGNYAVANINVKQSGFSRSGIDANTVLTSIALFDPDAVCDDTLFQPCSSRALANLKQYIDAFRTIYTINQGVSESGAGVATGRYAEDVYFNGNPWYLTTLAVAEQLYDAIQQWSTVNTISIDDESLAFWQSVYPSAQPGSYTKGGSSNFTKLTDAVLTYADGFVETALKYTPENGALSEQYSRENGTSLSAHDLTWSYASFITMRAARLAATSDYSQVSSWGSPSKLEVPTVCTPSSVKGTYKPAVAAGAPSDAPSCTYLVAFNLNATTFYGENIYLFGSSSDLGDWRVSDALAGSAASYSDARPLWTFTVELPAGADLEYKFLRKEPSGEVLYEVENRSLEVPECGDESPGEQTVEDSWNGPVGNQME